MRAQFWVEWLVFIQTERSKKAYYVVLSRVGVIMRGYVWLGVESGIKGIKEARTVIVVSGEERESRGSSWRC